MKITITKKGKGFAELTCRAETNILLLIEECDKAIEKLELKKKKLFELNKKKEVKNERNNNPNYLRINTIGC